MSTFTDDQLHEDPELNDPDAERDASGLTPAERRVLQRERDEARAETTRLKQDLAVRDANLSLDAEQLDALRAVHKGDWTSEAIRDTAVRLKWVEPPPPDVPDAEMAAQQRIADAASGGTARPADAEADIDARLREASARGDQAEFDRIYRESGRPMAQ